MPLLLGCTRTRPPAADYATRPFLSLSSVDLVARINADSSSIGSIKGRLDLGMRVAPGDSFRRCRGVLACRNPWGGKGEPGLFLKGYRQLIPTLFTLVSNGRDYWLHVPRENAAYSGPIQGPRPAGHAQEIRLDVGDLFRALFVEPIAPRDSVSVSEEELDYVVAIFRDRQLRRRMWIERRAITVPREVYYGSSEGAQLQIDRTEYADIDGRPYPMRLVLSDAEEGSTVLLEFDSITLDPKNLDDRLFLPELPEGTLVRRADSLEAP